MLLLLLSSAEPCRSWSGVVSAVGRRTTRLWSSSSSSPSSSWWYYDKLGRPETIAAPMVAQSDLAFRRTCRELGTDLCYTQMILAHRFLESEKFRKTQLDVYPRGTTRAALASSFGPSQREAVKGLAFVDDERSVVDDGAPTVVQLAGHDPNTVVEAALMILERAADENGGSSNVAGFDVNLGCPQSIARRGRYGAFLLPDTNTVCDVLSALRRRLPPDVGVSAKMRVPPFYGSDPVRDPAAFTDPAADLRRCVRAMIDRGGVDLVTVHGRTVTENKTRCGACDWDMIRVAVEAANGEIPVVANGGIERGADVARCLAATGAAAVMSSEALLENPGLFGSDADADASTARRLVDRGVAHARRYLDRAAETPPLVFSGGLEGGSFNVVRAHLFKMLHRSLQLDRHVDLRERLGAHHGPRRVDTIARARELVDELEARHADHDDDEMERVYRDSTSWYRRHRSVGRARVHERGTKETGNNEQREAAAVVDVEEQKRRAKERIRKMRETRRLKEENRRRTTAAVA